MVNSYLEKVYAGFLGMNAGIRLGAPVEPTIWTYERIQSTYGDITDYVKEYKNFAADDDANGPVFFLRALIDDAKDRPLEPQDVARAWLNYAREGLGMFWWGGYGISTEHTAYLNLKNGIPAPQSGSIAQNGLILAEQIGGQIFIDTWGLVAPGNPKLAADYGQAAASVSHDGNGLYGARFMCAAIAKAFETSDINAIVDAGLAELPAVCTYRAVMEAVRSFHAQHPDNWRDCMEMLIRDWGYDKYTGVCHIIPNAGVCMMALLYGNGTFDRTIEIATMAGWDTDCNAGNVGTILGVATGIAGIPRRYLDPINDSIVCSGISGYLNILDIPSFCREIAVLGYRLAGEEVPQSLAQAYRPGEIYFDFELPGSTHNIRLSDKFLCTARHSTRRSYAGTGSLEILLDRMYRGQQCKVFYKPFYLRDDFSDERYSPVFTPTVYSGQTVSMKLYLDQWTGNETPGVAPYIRTASNRKEHLQGYIKLVRDQWIDVTFTIPDTNGDMIDEVGIVLEGYSPASMKTLGMVYLDEFTITGKSRYSIDISKQRKSFAAITPFSTDHGAWSIMDGQLNLMRMGDAFAYTGSYYSKDYRFTTTVTPRNGTSHLIIIRSLGTQRFYAAGFGKQGQAVLLKNDFGFTTLTEKAFDWQMDTTYQVAMEAQGSHIRFFVNGELLLEAEDSAFDHGMYGCGALEIGRTDFGSFTYEDM